MNTVLIVFTLLSNGNYEPLFAVPFKIQQECEQQRAQLEAKSVCIPKINPPKQKRI